MNTDFITEVLIANEGLIIASSALSALFCVLLVWRTLLWRDPMAGRLATIHARGRSLEAETIIATRRRRRADQGMNAMRLMVKRLHLLKSKEAGKATLLLARAGIRKRDALILYFILRLVLPFAFGAVAILFIFVLPIAEMTPVDLVLIEGFKTHAHAKLEVHRTTLDKPLLHPEDPLIVAVASDRPIEDLALPRFDVENIQSVADFVESHCGLKRPAIPGVA